MNKPLVIVALAVAPLPCQTVQFPFTQDYTVFDLGSPAGVPPPFGGLIIDPANPNVLLIGGNANQAGGAIYAVPLTRNGAGSITGFSGPAQMVAPTPNIDGGVAFAPNGLLLFTRYSTNALGQTSLTSATMIKSVALTALGVSSSVGAMNIVPPGYPNAGHIKLATYNNGNFYDAVLVADGQGGYDVTSVVLGPTIPGGPEGIVYPPPGSPQLTDYGHVVISEYGAGRIVVYDIDQAGNPIVGTAQVMISGLSGAEGANLDPVAGDFLFSTFGGGDRVILVRGFGTCGTYATYGQGTPGIGGVAPHIQGLGCPLTGNSIFVQVTGTPPNAFGALNVGDRRLNVPFLNLSQLTNPLISVSHFADAAGSYTFTESLPSSGIYSGFTFYFQAGYLDSAAQFGISTTAGLQMDIR